MQVLASATHLAPAAGAPPCASSRRCARYPLPAEAGGPDIYCASAQPPCGGCRGQLGPRRRLSARVRIVASGRAGPARGNHRYLVSR